MRVALVCQHFPPELEGGTEVVVAAQARALAELGHDVRVLAGSDTLLAPGAAELLRERVGDVEVTRLPRRADEPYGLVLSRPRLLDHVLREVADADVCHVHHWSTLDAHLVRSVAEKCPVVVTLHDHFTSCPRFFRRQPAAHDGPSCPHRGDVEPCVSCLAPDLPGYDERALRRRLALRMHGFRGELEAAAVVLAPSRRRADAASALLGLPPERIEVLPHGLCRPIERAASPVPYHPDRRLVVLHFGNLCAEKGTLDLMQSLALLPPGSVELRLAGRALDPGFGEVVGRLRERLPVEHRPSCDPAALRELAGGADLAAFPSRLDESYGLVVDEALALGLPVWLSQRAAAGERLAEWAATARVLPAEEPAAWSAAFQGVRAAPRTLTEERRRVPRRLPTAMDAARRLTTIYDGIARGERA